MKALISCRLSGAIGRGGEDADGDDGGGGGGLGEVGQGRSDAAA